MKVFVCMCLVAVAVVYAQEEDVTSSSSVDSNSVSDDGVSDDSVNKVSNAGLDIDMNGYILYCPCMGRFGNQADHFLGALSFAEGLNRTLVLPPWVEYRPGERNSVQVPFDTYFRVSVVNEYHRAITMETFMQQLAPKIWPVGKRTVYCYSTRRGDTDNSCNAKDGNPFGPFWDTFNIDFDHSEFFGPLDYNTRSDWTRKAWSEKYPVREHPILAFTGAPGAFPVREADVELHRYLQWSDDINKKAEDYIAEHLQRPFIGIHMRNGNDFKRACEHVEAGRNLFGSAQCLGYRQEFGELSPELCDPPEKAVIQQLKKAVKKYKARTVYVATDNDPMIAIFEKNIKRAKFFTQHVKDRWEAQNSPHVDLAILGKADHYIGNCVSTFSAFAARERKVFEKTNEFWSFHVKKHHVDEL